VRRVLEQICGEAGEERHTSDLAEASHEHLRDAVVVLEVRVG
jgi:hypothetical protein